MSQARSLVQQNVPQEILPVLIQQAENWDRGTRVPVETLLRNLDPELRQVAGPALIKQEIVMRAEAGEMPTIDEYLTRFPDYSQELSAYPKKEDEACGVFISYSGEDETANQTGKNSLSSIHQRQTLSRPANETSPDLATGAFRTPTVDSKSDMAAVTSESLANLLTSEPPDSPKEGRLIGPYRLIRLLGQGGMGAVYQAVHSKLDKIVAIKLLTRDSSINGRVIERFEREMRAVGKLSHPNIVGALDAGEAAGHHFLVMEYVEGQDISRLIRQNGAYSVGQTCEIVRQAAQGLHEAHAQGLVHRDIKPSNLFLTHKGLVKILDLGLARVSEVAGLPDLTHSGQCMGTPDYMAPEQWTNARDVDGRTDLYALGCTMYQLLTGRPPFGTPDNDSLGTKVMAHISLAIPDIRKTRKDIPSEVVAILEKLLAKDRRKRYQSGADLAIDLLPFCTPLDGSEKVATVDESVLAKSIQLSKTRPGWSGMQIFGGIVALALMLPIGGILAQWILIRIRDKQGRVTLVEVPEESSIELLPQRTVPASAGTGSSGSNSQGGAAQKSPGTKQASSSQGRPTAVTVRSIPQVEKSLGATSGGHDDLADDNSVVPAPGETSIRRKPNQRSQPPVASIKGGKEPTVIANKMVSNKTNQVETTGNESRSPESKPDMVASVKNRLPLPSVPEEVKTLVPVPLKLPMKAAEIVRQQVAWSHQIQDSVATTFPSVNISFVTIPPGEFDLTSFDQAQGHSDNRARPSRRVRFEAPFLASQQEISVAQFRQFTQATNYRTLAERENAGGLTLGQGLRKNDWGRDVSYSWRYAGDIELQDQHPVTNISWFDAIAYCDWLSITERCTCRLPTEAEWEYMAIAGLGETPLHGDQWYESLRQSTNIADISYTETFRGLPSTGTPADWNDSLPGLAIVGKSLPNSIGLQDMLGNVSEFCLDRSETSLVSRTSLTDGVPSVSGSPRTLKGASWASGPEHCLPSARKSIYPAETTLFAGFRIVRELNREDFLSSASNLPFQTQPSSTIAEKCARWILERGGRVKIRIGTDVSNDILQPSELPTGRFEIDSISLVNSGLSDYSLLNLQGLKSLRDLDLSQNPITDQALQYLNVHKELKRLHLAETAITGSGVIQLHGFTKLTELNLSRNNLSASSITPIGNLKSLESLQLNSVGLNDDALRSISNLTRLKELSLKNNRLIGSGLPHLKSLLSLTTLDLSGNPLENQFALPLGDLRRLKKLDLAWTTLSDLGIKNLGSNFAIQELNLQGLDLTDFNIDNLSKLRMLKSLNLLHTDFTVSGLEELKGKLGATEISASSGSDDLRVATICLQAGGTVTFLENGESKKVTTIADLPKDGLQIKGLTFNHSEGLKSAIYRFSNLHGLTSLNLSGSQLTDGDLPLLTRVPNLEKLNLDDTQITGQSASHLLNFKMLKQLSIERTRVPPSEKALLNARFSAIMESTR